MPDLPDWQTSVSIDAANVTITVSGAVTIASGSVTIANASIAVINASGTKITSARPAKFLAEVLDTPNPNTQAFTLDADVQALVVILPYPLAQFVHVKIAWHPISGGAIQWVPLELFAFTQFVYVIPITPTMIDQGGNTMTQVDITLQGTVAGNQAVFVYELFESAPIWLEFFAPPFAEPNQAPGAILKTLAANVGQWLIAPVANVRISVFEIIELYTTNFGAADVIDVGHATALPANQGAATGKLIEMAPMGAVPFVYPFHGAQLPRGDGIYVINSTSAAGNFGGAINYSLD